LDGLHSPEYKQAVEAERKAEEEKRLAQKQEEQRKREEAKAKAEAEKLAKKQAKEEAKAKAEAEKLAKKQAKEETKAKAEAEKLAKKQAKEEAKAKAEAEKLAKKQAKEEAKAKAEAEKLAKKQAELEAKAQAEAQKKLEQEQKKAEELNKKTMAKFEKALKKHNSKEIIELYNSSDSTLKGQMKDKIDSEYISYVMDKKSHILSRNYTEINKLYTELKFLDNIPEMKSKNIWTIYSCLNDIVSNYTALEKLKEQYPNASSTGLIKSPYDILEIDCYVNYKIKSSGVKIGNITINNESYTDMYFISGYSYNEIAGYLPSYDWSAVLRPRDTVIDSQGVYSFRVVQSGTETLIDSNGFEKEYPLYIEVTQKDIDIYNKNKDFIDKSRSFNEMIDNSIKQLSKYL